MCEIFSKPVSAQTMHSKGHSEGKFRERSETGKDFARKSDATSGAYAENHAMPSDVQLHQRAERERTVRGMEIYTELDHECSRNWS